MRALIGFTIVVLALMYLGSCIPFVLPFLLLAIVTKLFKGTGQSTLAVRQPKW